MRQHVRKAILLCSFLLFPITLFYFSPALIIMGAAQGIVVASLMVFAMQFLSALIFGRAFCAWLCPEAGLQEACFPIRDRRVKVDKADRIKWGGLDSLDDHPCCRDCKDWWISLHSAPFHVRERCIRE